VGSNPGEFPFKGVPEAGDHPVNASTTEPKKTVRVGVISDTHGLLRPEAVEALAGSDLILHAGDVGDPEILSRLEAMAPLVAIRGNVDRGEVARVLRDTQVVEVEGHLIYILHDVETLDLTPAAAGIGMVIFGHSHMPEVRESRGVQYFNPGSAGPRRFSNPVTVGRLRISSSSITPEVVEIL
jgi:putative phosphoesterase